MLDYKDIITKHCALGMTGSAIAETLGVSKSGVNDFLRAFKACKDLKYPLPKGITNYGIAAVVYPRKPTTHVGRDVSYELPDYEAVSKDMSSRKNMTLKVLWNRYVKKCRDSGLKFYSYRQFCENYAKWCEENKETLHFNAVIGQKMEVDFAGKTFQMVDPLTGEVVEIVVFVGTGHCCLQQLQGGIPPLRNSSGNSGSAQGAGLFQVPETTEEDLRCCSAHPGRLPAAHHYRRTRGEGPV